jgi:hypothetical protein
MARIDHHNHNQKRYCKKQNGGRPRATSRAACLTERVLSMREYCLRSLSLLLTLPSSSSLHLKSTGAGLEREKREKVSMRVPLRCPARPPTACAARIPLVPLHPSLCHMSSGLLRRRGLADGVHRRLGHIRRGSPEDPWAGKFTDTTLRRSVPLQLNPLPHPRSLRAASP